MADCGEYHPMKGVPDITVRPGCRSDSDSRDANREIRKLRAENERLRGLLKDAKCPASLGRCPHDIFPELECDWCAERREALGD